MKHLLTLIFCGIFAIAYAQENGDDLFEATEQAVEEAEKNEALKAAENSVQQTENNEALYDDILGYKRFSLKHRQKVFEWQMFANKLIFVIVMLIVVSGLVLSYMHFYKSLKGTGEAEKTELEMSTSGIKMNSSVIGLIILVIAIAFLYLYLVHVFPINEFNLDTKAIPDL